MTEKPNCSNCPPFLNGDWCKLIINNDKDLKLRKRDPNGIELMEYTKLCGCLYHPGAREYLMKDVIQELELYTITDETAYAGCQKAVSDIAKLAISLLKGVKE